VSTGITPFEVVYERKARVIAKVVEGEVMVESVARDLKERDEELRQLKFHLE
jgi:hypothetical protein